MFFHFHTQLLSQALIFVLSLYCRYRSRYMSSMTMIILITT